MSNAGAFVLQKASTRVITVNGVKKRLRMPINIKCVSWKVFIEKGSKFCLWNCAFCVGVVLAETVYLLQPALKI